MTTPLTRSCRGGGGHQCKVNVHDSELREFEGHHYCWVHLPLASPKKNAQRFHDLLRVAIETGLRDFSGAQIPGGEKTQLRDYGAHTSGLIFRDSTIGGHVTLTFSSAEFSGSTFRGYARLQVGDLNCSGCTMKGQFNAGGAGDGTWRFRGCQFEDDARFTGVSDLQVLDFNGATFARSPRLLTGKLPQQCTFVGSRFKRAACTPFDEGTYRHIRNLFSANRARESEGFFYALEKECHRRALPRFKQGIGRSLSWLYDVTARYGQSYERAALWLLSVQIVFGIGYSIASGRWTTWGSIDGTVVSFTLSQIAKPFELLSARTPDSSTYDAVVGEEYSTGWVVATFAQSVLSILLIALLLLAIRWRFRRD